VLRASQAVRSGLEELVRGARGPAGSSVCGPASVQEGLVLRAPQATCSRLAALARLVVVLAGVQSRAASSRLAALVRLVVVLACVQSRAASSRLAARAPQAACSRLAALARRARGPVRGLVACWRAPARGTLGACGLRRRRWGVARPSRSAMMPTTVRFTALMSRTPGSRSWHTRPGHPRWGKLEHGSGSAVRRGLPTFTAGFRMGDRPRVGARR
jgi:hypothetical protein